MIFILDQFVANCASIPEDITKLVYKIIVLIQIAVPVLLVIYGMLDFGKAVMEQKEEDIKKGQKTFLTRLLAAALVFLTIPVAKFIIGLVSDSNDNEFWNCANEIISGTSSKKNRP